MRAAIIVALAAAGAVVAADKVSDKPAAPAAAPIVTVPGMPPVVNRNNIYSETNGPAYIAAAVKGDLERVYVPNLRSNDVSVIDPVTLKVVDKFKVGKAPQHVIVVGPAHPVGGQQCRAHQHRQPDAYRPAHRQAGQGNLGRRSIQSVLHAGWQIRHRGG
jgi:YVTN family beta-propeller protein